jgi:hypothetical protein
MCPIVNHVCTYFTKTIYFFGNLIDKNMLLYQFVIFWTKFPNYYNYYVLIWRKKFQLSLEGCSIFHLSLRNGVEWNI